MTDKAKEAAMAAHPMLRHSPQVAERVVAAVAAALDSEQGDGPHTVERCEIKGVDGPVVWWTVNCPDGYRIVVQSEPEATAVCAALNRVGRR